MFISIGIRLLSLNTKLHTLKLSGNPIAEEKNYRVTVMHFIPSIAHLGKSLILFSFLLLIILIYIIIYPPNIIIYHPVIIIYHSKMVKNVHHHLYVKE